MRASIERRAKAKHQFECKSPDYYCCSCFFTIIGILGTRECRYRGVLDGLKGAVISACDNESTRCEIEAGHTAGVGRGVCPHNRHRQFLLAVLGEGPGICWREQSHETKNDAWVKRQRFQLRLLTRKGSSRLDAHQTGLLRGKIEELGLAGVECQLPNGTTSTGDLAQWMLLCPQIPDVAGRGGVISTTAVIHSTHGYQVGLSRVLWKTNQRARFSCPGHLIREIKSVDWKFLYFRE